ncbi:MAG: hypothetical protein Q8M16_20540 [Pirellulaceae bacterium]|nr:hypothetical protein [Pirellulaceae bacterium]
MAVRKKRKLGQLSGVAVGMWALVVGLGTNLSTHGQISIAAPKSETRQYVDNEYFLTAHETRETALPSARSAEAVSDNCLPNWDSAWTSIDRPSLLADEDCGRTQPVSDWEHAFHGPHFVPQRHSRRPTSRPAMQPHSDHGRLNHAYTQSYRSQMPPIKEMHPSDLQHESYADDCEPDLFGSYQRKEKTPQPFGSRGQWFGRYEALVAWPYYSNGHPGLTVQSGPLSMSEPFDYNLIIGNRGVVGWESKKGPGGMFQYTDLFAISERLSAGVFGGVSGVDGEVSVPGFAGPFSISALPDERLESTAREHLTSYRPTAFKRVYFPVSTISGGFGFDYTVIRQAVSYSRFANLATTVPIETLDGRRRFSGIGPSFDIEYHRPIGHTQLAMLGGAQMGVLFGSDRWNVLQNGILTYQENSHRVITNATVRIGVEWSQAVGSRPDSRIFARLTIEGQNWLNAGNFSSPDSALGFLSGNFSLGAAY